MKMHVFVEICKIKLNSFGFEQILRFTKSVRLLKYNSIQATIWTGRITN